MHFFVSKFKWIMLAAGLLTCSMFIALISPQTSLKTNFGVTAVESVHADIIVRNWGALIGLIGIMMIYGAFVISVRRFVLVIAATSKVIFITLILSKGTQYLGHGAGTAVIADSIMVLLFIAYLLLSKPTKFNTA